LSRADLDDLLNRSGETAFEVRVRQGAEGPWSPFRTATAGARTAGSTSEAGSASEEADGHFSARLPVSPQTAFDWRVFLRVHWEIGAATGAWILINALFLSFWPQSYSRERRYLETLRAIEADVQAMRAKPASDAEWHQFAEQAHSSLAPIVSDLKKSASASEPVKQQLFWSARDLIPRTLGPRTTERDEQERQLRQYLDSAQREIDSR
jgi:hypothetical protein